MLFNFSKALKMLNGTIICAVDTLQASVKQNHLIDTIFTVQCYWLIFFIYPLFARLFQKLINSYLIFETFYSLFFK